MRHGNRVLRGLKTASCLPRAVNPRRRLQHSPSVVNAAALSGPSLIGLHLRRTDLRPLAGRQVLHRDDREHQT